MHGNPSAISAERRMTICMKKKCMDMLQQLVGKVEDFNIIILGLFAAVCEQVKEELMFPVPEWAQVYSSSLNVGYTKKLLNLFLTTSSCSQT